jgi:hypothetical protein
MKTENKILIGVGVAIVAYFIFKSKPKAETTSILPPSNQYNYRFKKDTTVTWFGSRSPNVKIRPSEKLFKENDIIEADFNPYSKDESVISTTLEGKKPDFNLTGQTWLTIPLENLTKI